MFAEKDGGLAGRGGHLVALCGRHTGQLHHQEQHQGQLPPHISEGHFLE